MKKLLNIVLISILIGLSTQQEKQNITSCLDYDRIDVGCFKEEIMEHVCNRTYTNVINNCENPTLILTLVDVDDDDEIDNTLDNSTDAVGVGIGFRIKDVELSAPDLVAIGVLNLGVDIFRRTAAVSQDKIQVISPLSIAGATSLMQLGAKGETLKELRKINGQIKDGVDDILESKLYHENFGLLLQEITSKELNSEEHNVTVANAIFAKENLKIRPEYRNAVTKVYKSRIENLDFQNQSELSTKVINEYANILE